MNDLTAFCMQWLRFQTKSLNTSGYDCEDERGRYPPVETLPRGCGCAWVSHCRCLSTEDSLSCGCFVVVASNRSDLTQSSLALRLVRPINTFASTFSCEFAVHALETVQHQLECGGQEQATHGRWW